MEFMGPDGATLRAPVKFLDVRERPLITTVGL